MDLGIKSARRGLLKVSQAGVKPLILELILEQSGKAFYGRLNVTLAVHKILNNIHGYQIMCSSVLVKPKGLRNQQVALGVSFL